MIYSSKQCVYYFILFEIVVPWGFVEEWGCWDVFCTWEVEVLTLSVLTIFLGFPHIKFGS